MLSRCSAYFSACLGQVLDKHNFIGSKCLLQTGQAVFLQEVENAVVVMYWFVLAVLCCHSENRQGYVFGFN